MKITQKLYNFYLDRKSLGWKNVFIKKINEFKNVKVYFNEFGFLMACVQLRETLIGKLGYSNYYIKKTSEYMIKELQPIIKKYNETTQNENLRNDNINDNEKIKVWICWFQGEENMPPIVKTCYHRALKVLNNEEMQVILITENNYQNYITFPNYIMDKYNRGIISKVQFSDILRWGLMAKFGGIWMDATVFLTYESIDDIRTELSYLFYTQKYSDSSKCPNEPSRGLWSNFYFMGQHKTTVRIFDFVYDAILFYWKKHDIIIHYVICDYIIWAAYQTIGDIKDLIDNVPSNNENLWNVLLKINSPCSEDEWMELFNKSKFYKLSYKGNLKEYTVDGQLTYYGRLINNNDC